jgi:hypothetical protein
MIVSGVVVREKDEPIRKFERRIACRSGALLNYQGPRSKDLGQWRINYLEGKTIKECREFKGRRILSPLGFNLEVRQVIAVREEERLIKLDLDEEPENLLTFISQMEDKEWTFRGPLRW